MKYNHYQNYYNIQSSDWGPYSKKYAGISHISSPEEGIRFDISVFTGFFKQKISPLNHKWDSGFVYNKCGIHLDNFTVRQELLGIKDIYTEHAYQILDENTIYVNSQTFNNSLHPRIVENAILMNINFDPEQVYSDTALIRTFYNGTAIHALDYSEINYKANFHTKHLSPDGYRRGEVLKSHSYLGKCLGDGFGKFIGDYVIYDVPNLPDDEVFLRVFSPYGETAINVLNNNIEYSYVIPRNTEFTVVPLNIKACGELKIISTSNISFYLDAIIISSENSEQISLNFQDETLNYTPTIYQQDNLFILKYENIDTWYGVACEPKYTIRRREFLTDYIERPLKYYTNEHVKIVIDDGGKEHYLCLFIGPITLEKESSNSSSYYILKGSSKQDIEQQAQNLKFNLLTNGTDNSVFCNKSGETYKFSVELLCSTLLTNIIYPVRTRSRWIKHFVPGKWWDCLYTWDGGFIALGFLSFAPHFCLDMLNAYVTDPGEPDADFIHHGSIVPVQFYVFKEYIDRSGDKEAVKFFYPRLKQYYNFALGRSEGSTMRLKSGILRSFDYFYNSGGWDDYCAQVYRLHNEGNNRYIAPVVNTSHFARAAKILSEFAEIAGYPEDILIYEKDISNMKDSLLNYSWDKEAGYFSYTIHDLEGNYIEKLYTEEGENFNKGVDGLSPIFANLFSGEIREKLLEHFLSNNIFTDFGITVVDRSSSYARDDGYWNGNVWMPYQWFFWKVLLDLGYIDEAYKLATIALTIWKEDTEADYRCRELFSGINGAGIGWNLFGGLSAPIISWFNAYFVPGTINVGFDSYIVEHKFSNNNSNLVASIKKNIVGNSVVLICLSDKYQYDIFINDICTKNLTDMNGSCTILLPKDIGTHSIQIKKSALLEEK